MIKHSPNSWATPQVPEGESPRKPAVITATRLLTFEELDRAAEEIAALLQQAVVEARSVVYLRAREADFFLAAVYGTWRFNCVVVPIYHQLPPREVSNQIESLGPGFLIEEQSLETILPNSVPKIESGKWRIFHVDGDADASFVSHYPDAAYLRFTSGTTGKAKGVVLTDDAIDGRTWAAIKGLNIKANDVILCPMQPAFHLIVSLISFLRAGSTVIVTPDIRGDSLLSLALEHGATYLYASPVHYRMLAAESSGRAWPKLRQAICTSTRLMQGDHEMFTERFGIAPSQALGIIEVGLPLANIFGNNAEQNPQSIGSPMMGYGVELLDEDGKILPDYEEVEGRLAISGPGIFAGYAAPYQPANDHMFITGDYARRDSGGNYYIKARASDVIHAGGHKVFPEQVEEILCQHPSVAVARVSGQKHPRWGEIIIADVVNGGEAPATGGELAAFCREYLAPYQIPRLWNFVSELPETPSGKIKRG